MEKKRGFSIKNMKEAVREVFEMTGFVNHIVREEGFAVVRKDEDGAIVLYLNGEMTPENIPSVASELLKLRKFAHGTDYHATVILDMEKILCILPVAFKHLKQALVDTAWPGRTLLIRNVPSDYLKDVQANALGEMIGKDGEKQAD